MATIEKPFKQFKKQEDHKQEVQNKEVAIQINHLDFGYRKEPIFQDVNLSIYENEWIAIIGPNGSGKTTLLKLIAHLLKSSTKAIHLKKGIQIGYMPQVIECNDALPISVLDVVLMGRLSKLSFFGTYPKAFAHEARELLEELQLLNLEKAPFSTLSLGQKQRVLFARALFSKPNLLLLDEPLASVDALSSSLIYQKLLTLKGKMTICFVTHDIEQMVNDVDRILCMHNKIQLIKPDDLCEHFALGLYHTPLVKSTCLT